ncbi:hypothetical protein NESM_000654200 [Novymonas esmeraldas]|uniref:Uncharacterized protein n=1 Tax=Novymonas esmeraldas TaxID=1808958 RepID=A0AAW0EU92_9TRYP
MERLTTLDSIVSLSALPEGSDPLLARLQDTYTRQKRQVAAQKRKHADLELQTAAAYYSDLPVSLELLSDGTASLFTELERLLEASHDGKGPPSREMALLQRIRQQTNRELRESMSFIEEGYRSGFEKLLRESRFEERRVSLAKAAASLSTSATTLKNTQRPPIESLAASSVASSAPAAKPRAASRRVPLQEALSASVSLMAESLAVLLQCEVVRVYLYDTNDHLECVATFPYHATRADPMQSSYLSMMAVREVHRIVCRERLAINGGLGNEAAAARDGSVTDASLRDVGSSSGGDAATGLEDIRTCLLLPVFSPQGNGRQFGMLHAVNKLCPTALGIVSDDPAEAAHVGFTVEDETLACSVARVLGTLLSRYPTNAFFVSDAGERLRRSAFPGDADVLSLTAHLPPALQDEVQEAAGVGQLALSRLTPQLVHRAPMQAIYEARTAAGESRRRKLAKLGPRDGAVSSVEFNLRCMNELWESSRDDNVTLHKQYRVLEEQVHSMRLLLRNVLDGVAAARAMPLSTDTAQFLHNLEMYGRSERTERMAKYVSEQMLAIPTHAAHASPAGAAAAKCAPLPSPPSHAATAATAHMSDAELHALRNHHARLNTVTPASLHFDGPNGVRSYTSDPAQKREQVRFIDELCRRARQEGQPTAAARRPDARRQAQHAPLPAVGSGTSSTAAAAAKHSPYPFQRPFKL